MKKNKINTVVCFLMILVSGVAIASPVEINPILKTTKSWNDVPLPGFTNGQTELSVLTYKIAPGVKTPIHLHPVNGAGYILSGELTMYATDDPHGSFADRAKVKTITLKAGQSWTEAVNTWHYGENKSDKDVTFVLMFAGSEKTPLTLSLQ